MKKEKKVVFLIIVFLVLLLVLFCTLYAPKIKIYGEKHIVIKVFEKYEDKGFIKSKIFYTKVINNVDTKKVGTYEVDYYTYSIFRIRNSKVIRKVIVVDDEKPVIELNGNKKQNVYLNEKYIDPGFIAIDNYDGDITLHVKSNGNVDISKLGIYTIEYQIVDSSNNENKAIREVKVNEKDTNGIPVLMYHFFYDKKVTKKPADRNYMEISLFDEQMKYLIDNDYYFPTWDELIDYIDKKIDLPKKSIIITADDGNKTFYELAVPILEKYKIPATSFVVANREDWKNYKDITTMVNYQSHLNGMHDRVCPGNIGTAMCSPYDEVVEDLKKSKETIGKSDAFAYPFGNYNNAYIKALKQNDFKLAFTVSEGQVKKGANKLLLPRVRMSNGITLNSFINKIK